MQFPVLYFTMPDGTKLRVTFSVAGFDWVRIDVAEQEGFWLFRYWSIKTHPWSGRSVQLRKFINMPKADIEAWARQEAVAWHEYSKVLKAYKP